MANYSEWRRVKDVITTSKESELLSRLDHIRPRVQLDPQGYVWGIMTGANFTDADVGLLRAFERLIRIDVHYYFDKQNILTEQGFHELLKMRQLKVLTIFNYPQPFPAAKMIGQHGALRWLGLGHCQVTDEDIRQICEKPEWFKLAVPGNPLTDACLPALLRLTAPRVLNLRESHISAAGRATIANAYPRCRLYWEDPAGPPTSTRSSDT